jgi:hypothetical protein
VIGWISSQLFSGCGGQDFACDSYYRGIKDEARENEGDKEEDEPEQLPKDLRNLCAIPRGLKHAAEGEINHERSHQRKLTLQLSSPREVTPQ